MTTLTIREQRRGPARSRTSWDGSDEQMMFARLTELPAGDGARDRLRAEIARRYLGLVESLAAPYRGRGEPFEDIVGAGRVGLVKAIDRFEPARGNSFITYATVMIVGEIKRHFRDTTWSVHVPRRLQEMRPRLRAAGQELAEAGVTEPTPGQLAAHLGLDEREIQDASAASNAYSSLSLDMPGTGDDDAPCLIDTMGETDAELDRVVDLEALRGLLGRLPERERTILLLRFYGNKTQSEIGAALGLSQMQVSRLLTRTLDELRQALTTDPSSSVSAAPPAANENGSRRGRPEGRSAHDRPTRSDATPPPEPEPPTPSRPPEPGPASRRTAVRWTARARRHLPGARRDHGAPGSRRDRRLARQGPSAGDAEIETRARAAERGPRPRGRAASQRAPPAGTRTRPRHRHPKVKASGAVRPAAGSSPAWAKALRAAMSPRRWVGGMRVTMRAISARRWPVTSATMRCPASVTSSRTSRLLSGLTRRSISPLATSRSPIRMAVDGLTPRSSAKATTLVSPRVASTTSIRNWGNVTASCTAVSDRIEMAISSRDAVSTAVVTASMSSISTSGVARGVCSLSSDMFALLPHGPARPRPRRQPHGVRPPSEPVAVYGAVWRIGGPHGVSPIPRGIR